MHEKPSLSELVEEVRLDSAMEHSDDIVDIYLEHYGVKGMKWGVINEDKLKGRDSAPKEVSAEKQAKRETRAQRHVERAHMYDTQIKELKVQKFKGSDAARQRDQRDMQVLDLQARKERAIADAEQTRSGRLTQNQKRVLIGAAVVGAIVAYKVGETYLQSGEFNRMSMKGLNAFDPAMAFKKNADLARKDMSMDEVWSSVAKKVNPNYGALGTKMNCRRCTFAYEMRRRGFDVEATRTTNAYGQNAIGLLNAVSPGEKFRKTGQYSATAQMMAEQQRAGGPVTKLVEAFGAGARNKINYSGPESIFLALSKEPPGSRGELGVIWSIGGGHSMAYEIFNGKPVIFDCQTGKRYSSAKALAAEMDIASAGFTRLDNVDLNFDYLQRWLKNVK